jgi:pimeloyl-ACP methyl ester carboxylesterase
MMKTHLWLRIAALCSLVFLASCAGTPGGGENGAEAKKDAGVLTGTWAGELVLEEQKLEIIVRFALGETLTGSIDIPQQAAWGLPLDNIRLSAASVYFELPADAGSALFCGELEEDLIMGTFTQSGIRGSFVLARRPEPSGPAREANATATAGPAALSAAPAEPPAGQGETRSLSVELEVPGGFLLAGTLELPAAPAEPPYPVVLIISGSGPTDRDGNSPLLPGPNNSLKMLARGLAAAGIASLRYDKRGVGESVLPGVSEEDLSFDDLIADAVLWLEMLRRDGRFSGVAVAGHSEGSLVGMTAANRAGADAFVSLAGPGRPIFITLRDQLASQPEAIRRESEEIMARIARGEKVEEMSPVLNPLFRPGVQPFLRSWDAYDPAAEFSRLEAPVLVVQGTRDLQVAPLEAEKLLTARPDAVYLEVADMNHVLKAVPAEPAANLAAYSDPDLPLAPGLVEGITAFLQEALQ